MIWSKMIGIILWLLKVRLNLRDVQANLAWNKGDPGQHRTSNWPLEVPKGAHNEKVLHPTLVIVWHTGRNLCHKVFAMFNDATTFFSSDGDDEYKPKNSRQEIKGRFWGFIVAKKKIKCWNGHLRRTPRGAVTRNKGYCQKWRRRWGRIKRGRDDLHYSPLSFVAVSWHNATTWMMKVGMQRNEGGGGVGGLGRGRFEGVDDAGSVSGGKVLTWKPHSFLSRQSLFSGDDSVAVFIGVVLMSASARLMCKKQIYCGLPRCLIVASCSFHVCRCRRCSRSIGGFSPFILRCAWVRSVTPGTTRPIPEPLIGTNSCWLSTI